MRKKRKTFTNTYSSSILTKISIKRLFYRHHMHATCNITYPVKISVIFIFNRQNILNWAILG